MKRHFLTLAIALSALITPASSAGAETQHVSFEARFAAAGFFTVDPSGCVRTQAEVFALEGRSKETGRPMRQAFVRIFISKFDLCSNTELLTADALAPMPAGAFQIDSQLTKAMLNMTVEVRDSVSNTSFPVAVSVSWTGTGPLFRRKDHVLIKQPSFKFNARFVEAFRNATASGTVSDGTTNFAPKPTEAAHMDFVANGGVTITY